MVLDRWASNLKGKFKINKKLDSSLFTVDRSLILARPTILMNLSGIALKKLITHFKIKSSDLWVIHDDLDIGLGKYKIQKGKGPKLHKGLLSIEKELATSEFWRVRVGIENRAKDNRISGEVYTLQNFEEKELKILRPVIAKIIKDLLERC